MAASSAARLSDIGFSPCDRFGRGYSGELVSTYRRRGRNSSRLAGKSLGVESGRQAERREDLGILEHRIPADAVGGDGEDLERVQLVSAADAPIGGEPGL